MTDLNNNIKSDLKMADSRVIKKLDDFKQSDLLNREIYYNKFCSFCGEWLSSQSLEYGTKMYGWTTKNGDYVMCDGCYKMVRHDQCGCYDV
jgi:hypothetical protein